MLITGFFIFLLGLITYVFIRTDKRSLTRGLCVNIALIMLEILFLWVAFSWNIRILIILSLIPLVLVLIVSTFGFFAFVTYLLITGRLILKREGVKFSNLLSLLLGVALILYWVISSIHTEVLSNEWRFLYGGVTLILSYFLIDVSNFLTTYLLQKFSRHRYNQDFLIVLGSGLIKNRVPPLLASRIDKAIEFYHCQKKVASPPIMIFSGGQGSDETIAEAAAMQRYALDKGIPAEHTLKEDQSTSTYENMLFSKRIMESLKGKDYSSIYFTNNFHVLRAGLYAKKLGLHALGVGSRTIYYYWTNAMIREYIGITVMRKKLHLIIISLILLLSLCLRIFEYFIFNRSFFGN